MKLNNRLRIFFILLIGTFHGLLAQSQFTGVVTDEKDGSALSFCAVAILHSSKGSLANEEGKFLIWARNNDTLVLEHPGYERKIVPIALLKMQPAISLRQQAKTLQEVTVSSGDAWMFDLFEKCRKTLLSDKDHSSKAYFTLQSQIGKQPVELLECYYNASLDAARLKNLRFKNGRAGAAQFGQRYFMNLNTSKVFTSIDLISGHDKMPHGPFEFTRQQLQKKFRLSSLGSTGGPHPTIHLAFTPIRQKDRFFSGEVWVDLNTGALKQISMDCGPTGQHPFLPIFPNGYIQSVTMHINKIYSDEGLPEHMDFKYDIRYEHHQATSLVPSNQDTVFTTSCKGLIYFYDYGKLFLEPLYSYDHELDDYRKIALLSGNEQFWNINQGPAYSTTMIEAVKYFKKHGELINFSNSAKSASAPRRQYFENHFIRWDSTSRLSLKKGRINNDTNLLQSASPLHERRYDLHAQIFMDLNQTSDSLQFYTTAIFDPFESWHDPAAKPYTRAFLNIYFDIYEIHRRMLQKRLSEKGQTPEKAIAAYQEIKALADKTSETYLNEVRMGENEEALFNWNEYVLRELGINNFSKPKTY